MEKRQVVVVFGTFDIIHEGHLDLFRQAKEAAGPGSKLVVAVARDVNVARFKGKKPINDENKRLAAVQSLDIVDEAVLGTEKIDFSTIDRLGPDMIALGYDQALPKGFDDYIHDKKMKVVRLRPHNPEKFKSSKIKEKI